LTSWLLEPILAWFQTRRNAKTYAPLEWMTNETLQIQRLAYEEAGYGNWSRTMKHVPITARDDLLGVLDMDQYEHPRLKREQVKQEEREDQLKKSSTTLSNGETLSTPTTLINKEESALVIAQIFETEIPDSRDESKRNSRA
jgi:hypothetical protein